MKQLVIAVLLAALLSLGYRLVGAFNADASDEPASVPKRETPKPNQSKLPIQPAAVRVDRPSAEQNCARDDTTGPNRTRRGDDVSKCSSAVPRSAAKPLNGDNPGDLATSRMPPPAPPSEPRMIGPDGIVFHRAGPMPSAVSALRLTPPLDEPLVQAPAAPQPEPAPAIVRDDKPLSLEPPALPPPASAQVRGRMIGPDGIEFHSVKRGP